MLEAKTAVPYSRCGEPSVGASTITVSIYASSPRELEERYDSIKNNRILGAPVNEYSNGRWIKRWKETRATLADVVSFSSWNRRPKQSRKDNHHK